MEVANPSALFLAERRGNIAGSAVFAASRARARC
jgi:DNA repair protein RadA/Sms